MSTATSLQQHAINAAKEQNWPAAIEINQTILATTPEDLGALNRLGVALVQTGDLDKAETQFKAVLKLDKSNPIAKKHLQKLQANQVPVLPSFTQAYFIEEPGKAKIVELHRLAGKSVLDELTVGHSCELKPKNRYISIETQGKYVGALPEDLSFRLTKLLSTGNLYECYVHSLTPNSCQVYLKETFRSDKNQDVHSFPPIKNTLAAINEIDEELLFEENIPVEVVETDRDMSETERDIEDDDKTFEPIELPGADNE